MRFLIRRWSVRFSCILIAALLLAGCVAGKEAYDDGEEALTRGDYDEALTSLTAALDADPLNTEYRLKYNYARNHSAKLHNTRGDTFFEEGNYPAAQREYQIAADLGGSLFVLQEKLALTGKYLQAQKLTTDAEAFMLARRHLQAKRAVERALSFVNHYEPALKLKKKLEETEYTVIDGVELEVTSTQPITLNFNNAKLPDVFEILTNLSGINFILDEDVRGNNTTLFLEQATFSQALELLLRMNKLDKKILNRKTIILFPKNRDKQKQFEDQLIQTFYLSNIDAKKAVNLLRTMLQVRKIYVHEELNAIIIRDTAPVIKLAQKILEANDRSTSEVVFDLELIEVNHVDREELGTNLSNYSIDVGMGIPGLDQIANSALSPGSSTEGLIDGIDGFKELSPFYAIPTATFRFMKTQGDAEILASPKIRVKNKEKAKVHIGSREPVITTSTSDGGTVSENVQYIDVGVKLDVEPVIQLDNTIVTKVSLEVSNVSGRDTTDNGTAVITISTTNANTALTLKDGEQTIMGGLIRNDKTSSKQTIPFIGSIPLIGRLVSGNESTDIKREILLSITPHIVKTVAVPDNDVASIWSGGEDDLKFGRNFGSFAAEYTAGQKGVEPELDPMAEPLEDAENAPDVQPAAPVETVPVAEEAAPLKIEADAVASGEMVTLPQPEAVDEVSLPPDSSPVTVNQATVYVKGPELVKVDELFSLVFFVNEVSDLFSAPLYVQFDEQLFEFIDAEEGSFLKQGASPTIFTHTALEGSGRIIVGLKQGAGGNGISGGGELFIMNFKAKKTGKGKIEPTRTNFRNPQGTRLKVEPVGLEVEAR